MKQAPSPNLARGQSLFAAGRPLEAEKYFTRVLAEEPRNLTAMIGLGSVCLGTARPANAFRYFAAAAEIEAKPAILTAAGAALRALGKLPEAEAWHSRATFIDPKFAEAYYNLGMVYQDTLNIYGWHPNNIMGGPARAAVECFTRFATLEPFSPVGLVQRGVIYMLCGRDEDAIKDFYAALVLDPKCAAAFENLGTIFLHRGDVGRAEQLFDQALPLYNNDNHNAVFRRAQWKLKIGRYAEGFVDFERRHQAKGIAFKHKPERWNGVDSLAGKTLIIADEQGIGDALFFARFIPNMIASARADGFKLHIFVRARLRGLFARSFAHSGNGDLIKLTVVDETKPRSWPGVGADYYIPLGSLPGLFVRSAQDLPTDRAYIKASAITSNLFRRDLLTRARGRKIVGVSWRSGAPNLGGFKSAAIDEWISVFDWPGYFFVSLQYGDVAADVIKLRAAGIGEDRFFVPAIDPVMDFDDSVAATAACDMVITISNACAHTAGALGVPTSVVLPYEYDSASFWYWGRGCARAPFYPSVRLFRASKRGPDWYKEALYKVRLTLAGGAP